MAYEKQEKDKSFKIHFDKVQREEGTNKTILLKRPSQVFPYNIEDSGDITLKLQLEHERRNLAVEVVSIKAEHPPVHGRTHGEQRIADWRSRHRQVIAGKGAPE